MPVLVARFQPFTGAASEAMPSGYAALVRQAAPSVVTVIVEEQRIGAEERAAARAAADTGSDAIGTIIRRLLSGANGSPGGDDRASHALGSGFVIRADGLIVTNRHVIADARTVRVRLADPVSSPRRSSGGRGHRYRPAESICRQFARASLRIQPDGFRRRCRDSDRTRRSTTAIRAARSWPPTGRSSASRRPFSRPAGARLGWASQSRRKPL